MGNDTGPDPLSPDQRISILRGHLEREKSRRREAEARLAAIAEHCRTRPELAGAGYPQLAADILAIIGSEERGGSWVT
jgi:hypothetical protein